MASPRSPRGSLWQHRDFVYLWSGQTVSVFGSLMSRAAIPFIAVLKLGAGALEVALLQAAAIVPALLAGFVAGVWVDRLPRRPLMIACDIGRAAIVATVPVAWAFDALTIAHLAAVAFSAGVLTMFFDVAYLSYLPTLVEREELVEGNSKLAASASVSEFAGFSAAGWLVQALSGAFALAIDALTFVFSAACITLIRTPEPPREQQAADERPSMVAEAGEGLRVVRAHALLRPLAIAVALQSTGFGVFGAIYAVFVLDVLDFEPGPLGAIYGVGGIFSLLGATYAGTAARRFGAGNSMVLGLAIMSACMFIAPLTAGPVLVVAALLTVSQVGDGPFTVFDVNSVSLRQGVTPEQVLGRVNAFMRTTELACMLAGTVAGGLVAQGIGIRPTLAIGGALSAAAALIVLTSPVRPLRDVPSVPLPTDPPDMDAARVTF